MHLKRSVVLLSILCTFGLAGCSNSGLKSVPWIGDRNEATSQPQAVDKLSDAEKHKEAMTLRPQLGKIGIDYVPRADQLDNDIKLMKTIKNGITLEDVVKFGDFGGYTFTSIKGSNRIYTKSKLVRLDYSSSSAEVLQYLNEKFKSVSSDSGYLKPDVVSQSHAVETATVKWEKPKNLRINTPFGLKKPEAEKLPPLDPDAEVSIGGSQSVKIN